MTLYNERVDRRSILDESFPTVRSLVNWLCDRAPEPNSKIDLCEIIAAHVATTSPHPSANCVTSFSVYGWLNKHHGEIIAELNRQLAECDAKETAP